MMACSNCISLPFARPYPAADRSNYVIYLPGYMNGMAPLQRSSINIWFSRYDSDFINLAAGSRPPYRENYNSYMCPNYRKLTRNATNTSALAECVYLTETAPQIPKEHQWIMRRRFEQWRVGKSCSTHGGMRTTRISQHSRGCRHKNPA